jgi:hypothetical protein
MVYHILNRMDQKLALQQNYKINKVKKILALVYFYFMQALMMQIIMQFLKILKDVHWVQNIQMIIRILFLDQDHTIMRIN